MMADEEAGNRFAPRLPTDPAYWTGLTNRIVASAEPTLEQYRWMPWWKPLARFGPPLGLAAAGAALAVVPFTWGGDSASPQSRLEFALAPRDPIAREFVLSTEPPDISTLLSLHQEDPQ